MWRKISYYARVVYNFVRIPLWSLLNGGKIKFVVVQKLSPLAHISVGKNGTVVLKKQCMAEAGTLLRAGNGKLELGDKVFFNRNCTIVCNCGIQIEEGSTFGPGVCIFDHDHDMKNWNGFIAAPIHIGKKVWVGANATILKGVTIGDNVVIGAGAVVTHDLPAGCVLIAKHEEVVKKVEC